MFVHVAGRAQLGEVLSGRRPLSSRPIRIKHPPQLPQLEALSVAAVWAEDPADHGELPEYLLTADGDERDWLAWLVNFAPSLRPFTAFCRVVSVSTFSRILDAFQRPDLGSLENACIGLILGEALSAEEVLARPREPLAASACASVLSFVLCRELAVSSHRMLHDDELLRRWARVRELTRQRERSLDPRDVVGVAEVLRVLLHSGPVGSVSLPVLHACRELRERGEVLSEAGVFGPAFEKAAHTMRGTREERVGAFEQMVSEVMSGERALEADFAIGYLASRINPGTLAHAGLVATVLKRYPAAMLWYGACAGLAESTTVTSEFGGVGRRVLRELMTPEEVLGRPRCDVSASELEILLAGERADDFAVWSPSQLSVELAPGVSTVVNWSSRARTRRSQELGERPEERAWIEYELGAAINRLVDLHRRVRGDRDLREREPEQEGLFDRRPDRRGSRKR